MTGIPNIAAIVPAAGLSRRMGAFKPLMDLGGATVIERVVALYGAAGVTDVRVVVGHCAERLRKALQGCPAALIHHRQYRRGMFSSVRRGVAALDEAIEAFFIHPADIPLVRPHTIRSLMRAFAATPATVTCPVFDGRPGHPPLIRRDAAAAIVSHDGEGGLRRVLERFEADTHRIPVADRGILLDLDTPEDAAAVARRMAHANCLDDDECRVLMGTVLQLPEPVVDHCRRVAQVATAIADAVNQGGGAVDAALVRSAALVHDASKGRPDHAAAGAALLTRMGFPDMAAIMAVHMHIAVAGDQPLDEAQIVYLADKLVDGDALVGLDRRFSASLDRHGSDPAAAEAVARRRNAARGIRDKVAAVTGRTLSAILEQAGLVSGGASCGH